MRRNFSWALVGNFVYAGCQWGMLIVLAKLGSPAMVGQFALALAITGPVMLFANLQLTALQATDAAQEYRFGHYLALRLITTMLGLAAIAGIALGAGYSPATMGVLLAVGLGKAFEAISDAYHGLMQQHGRMDRVARSLMLKGPLSLLALAAAVWLSGSVATGALALAGTWGLLLLLYDVRSPAWLRAGGGWRVAGDGQSNPVTRHPPPATRPCWEWAALRRLAWLALPLGLVTVLLVLSANIPRYFVEQRMGEGALGIFAALAYVTVVGQLLSNALGQAAAPRLAAHYAAGNLRAFRVLVLKLVGLGTAVGAAGVLVALVAGRFLLGVLYQAEYGEYTDVFTMMMAGAGLWCAAMMFCYAATAARRNRSQLAGAVAVTLATLVASAVLIEPDSL
ncbi:MAG TPA: lipopolysaccharide biosynthesis protein, partial [Gemmataceae bacterium]|nr:lipopolysaccharide biosynthesis protein [Gemmataceae bacterium]